MQCEFIYLCVCVCVGLVCYLVETDPFNKSILCLLYQTYSGNATLYSLQLSTQSLVVFHKTAP